MGQVSNIFQYINDEGEVVEYPRFANIKTISNLVDVINKGKDGLTTAEAVAKTMQLNMWDSYKRKLEIYGDVKTAIEDNNAANVENPDFTPEALPVKPTWSDDDVAHITTEYVLGSPEVLEAKKSKLKEKRSLEVDNIVVEVDGMSFDGDEVSQNRMARAITALSVAEQPSTTWKLSNNELATVTKEQLAQALALAGQAQTDIWAHYG